ncbi:hypothetical protein ABPG74_020671 [Tetrahymena malaccensis]
MQQNNHLQREYQDQDNFQQLSENDENEQLEEEYFSQDDEFNEDDQQQQYMQRKEVELKRRYNLYDILKQYREEGEHQPVSRLFYAAYYNEAALQQQNIELDSYMQTKINQLQESLKEQFQGYFLIKGSFSIHLLEAESNALNEFVKELHSDYHKEKSIYQNINIIAFTEENSNRFYNKWYCDNIYQAGPTLSQDIDKSEKQVQDRSWEIFNQVCQAGSKYSQKGSKKQQKLATEINISTDDMSVLMSKFFTHIDDYYNLYLSDIEIQLDTELQYPYQPSLISILEFSTLGKLGKLDAY